MIYTHVKRTVLILVNAPMRANVSHKFCMFQQPLGCFINVPYVNDRRRKCAKSISKFAKYENENSTTSSYFTMLNNDEMPSLWKL